MEPVRESGLLDCKYQLDSQPAGGGRGKGKLHTRKRKSRKIMLINAKMLENGTEREKFC